MAAVCNSPAKLPAAADFPKKYRVEIKIGLENKPQFPEAESRSFVHAGLDDELSDRLPPRNTETLKYVDNVDRSYVLNYC